MKIRKLELHGFKSFVDRTVVRFDSDVLGIVGPNGCGKSNIDGTALKKTRRTTVF